MSWKRARRAADTFSNFQDGGNGELKFGAHGSPKGLDVTPVIAAERAAGRRARATIGVA